MINKQVVKLLEELMKSKEGKLHDNDAKKILGIDDQKEINSIKNLSERCGYIKPIDSGIFEITSDGARFLLENSHMKEQSKFNLNITLIQLFTFTILLITALIMYFSSPILIQGSNPNLISGLLMFFGFALGLMLSYNIRR